MANPDDYVVLIPSDGSVISGYTTIINKYAKQVVLLARRKANPTPETE